MPLDTVFHRFIFAESLLHAALNAFKFLDSDFIKFRLDVV